MKKSIYFFKMFFLAVLFSSGLSLMAQTPEIELQQPTGGETWTGGGTYLISWLDNFNGNVDVLYKQNYGTGWSSNHIENGILTYPETDDLLANIQSELGENYILADWEDLKTIPLADLDQWITDMGWDIPAPTSYWILNNGIDFNPANPTYHYLVKYHDDNGNPPSHVFTENIGGKIWLGSYFGISRPILAKKTATEYTAISPVNGLSGASCYWHTIGLELGTYQIKVRSHNVPNDDNYADESSDFTLVDQEGGFITLIQPEGGEVWMKNNIHLISWEDNLNEPVKISVKESGDPDFTVIAGASSVVGSTFEWPTNMDVGTYKIKIESTVSNATTPAAISPDFQIVATTGTMIEVLQPSVTGIKWAVGTRHLVSWNDDIPGTVDVYWVNYENPAAPTFGPIQTNVIGTTLYWDIPSNQTPGTSYKIKLYSSDDNTIVDWSDEYFEISKSGGEFVEVLQPTEANISWARGTSHLISWIDDLPENVTIELVNYGVTPNTFTNIASSVEGTTHVWAIPAGTPTGDKYKIKIISVLDNTIADWSTEFFSITASAGTTVEVLQPSITGIKWQGGTEHLISWIDDCPEAMGIELVDYSSGFAVFTSIATNVVGSTYVWEVPDGVTFGNHFKIKVYSMLNSSVADKSDNYFNIAGSIGTYISVIQPNGGEVWSNNQSYYISWEDDFLEGVDIYLDRVDPAEHVLIKANAIGSTWVWPISGIDTDTDYKIYIESVNDASINDDSDATFTILPFVMLNAYPNPASNMLTLEVTGPNEQVYQVTMYDRFNTEVYNASVNTGAMNQLNISTQDLPNGVYFLNVTSNTYNASRKIIVNHR